MRGNTFKKSVLSQYFWQIKFMSTSTKMPQNSSDDDKSTLGQAMT